MNLSLSQIPPTIDTVEKLSAWCGLLLHRNNTTLKVLESPNFSDFACQASIFLADDQTERLVIRLNLPLNSDFASSGLKIWNSVGEFSEIAIPAAYLS